MSDRCPACRRPMGVLALAGRGDATVVLDHCDACRLVWFDPLEFDTLAPQGWANLLLRMVDSATPQAPSADGGPPPEATRCPRCDSTLRAEPRATSFGRHVACVCPRGHGQAQRDGALLASRGLFRPLLLDERVALAMERRQLHCLPCGSAMDGRAEQCRWCGSPATVFDLPRLARALGLERPQRRPADAPLLPWACHGCGSPLDATQAASCPQCKRPVLAPSMVDIKPLLQAACSVLGRRARAAGGFVDAMLQQLGWGFWHRWAAVMGCAGLLALAGWITSP